MSAPETPLKGKELVIQYFAFFQAKGKPKPDTDHEVVCKCGWKGKYRTSKGYTNEQSHIVSLHPEYSKLSSNMMNNQMLVSAQFYPSNVTND
jgi:hypothetical protein